MKKHDDHEGLLATIVIGACLLAFIAYVVAVMVLVVYVAAAVL